MPGAASSVIFMKQWACCGLPPGSANHPDELPPSAEWLATEACGTVAHALHTAGRLHRDAPRDLDADDWWFRTTFTTEETRGQLGFAGLATLADVWLNGQPLLSTDNMFRCYRVDVGPQLRPSNTLVIRFRSLTEDLKKKRPRPPWKTNLVSNQQLRWYRTSLLGRIPGWSPPTPTVGPWRDVWFDARPCFLSDVRVSSRLEGQDGIVTFQARLKADVPPPSIVLQVRHQKVPVQVSEDATGWSLSATVRLERPPLWWPHTHGEQHVASCVLHVDAGGEPQLFACGAVGFRHLDVCQDYGLSIRMNGVPLYCRGACWTVSDMLRPGAGYETVSRDLRLARAAGVNMLRVGGTMVYESDWFYGLCAQLGILVWQDFMFANMDYPVDDPAFSANIEAEAREQLCRLSGQPALAVLCGNSEVEQQAAMVGAPRERWRNLWFATRLPELCAEYQPETAYTPSTPSGGVLPFHVGEGVAHYYGVGAYLRSPWELRQADVKFAAECLGFANVPEPATIATLMDGGAAAVHDPRWKRGVPRDSGAGWDFDDVRDHYLQQFFGVDPVRLRCFDMPRYLQLSRVVSGEMMTQVFGEWRSGHSRNQGGLVWFFKDLVPGAGFGIVDSTGLPKAAYYQLRRAWQSRQITLTDEGLDGLHLHVSNETAEPLTGSVELLLLKDQHTVIARHEIACSLPARGRQTFTSAGILERFLDVTYAYRFGPPQHDLAVATLFDDQRRVLSEAFYFVFSREPSFLPALQLEAFAEPAADGGYQVQVRCDHFLQSVSLEAKGYLPDDNYFYLVPERARLVRFSPIAAAQVKFRATMEALNLKNPVTIQMKETPKT